MITREKKVRAHAKVKPEDLPVVLELLKTKSITDVARQYGYEQSSGLFQILKGYGIDTRQFARKQGNHRKRSQVEVEAVTGESVTDESGATVIKCPIRYAGGVVAGPTAKPKGRS